jgi:hypothetical protein
MGEEGDTLSPTRPRCLVACVLTSVGTSPKVQSLRKYLKRKVKMRTDKRKVTKQGVVALAHIDFFGLSELDGGKWVLMCETHSEFIQDTCKKRLWSYANESFAWCASCQEIQDAKENA